MLGSKMPNFDFSLQSASLVQLLYFFSSASLISFFTSQSASLVFIATQKFSWFCHEWLRMIEMIKHQLLVFIWYYVVWKEFGTILKIFYRTISKFTEIVYLCPVVPLGATDENFWKFGHFTQNFPFFSFLFGFSRTPPACSPEHNPPEEVGYLISNKPRS